MTDTEPTTKAIQVKLVLLGEAAVGKSSLVLRFVQDDFNENNSPTIGAAFLTQKCRLEDKVIKFEIWDTAGQERFHSLAPMYYRNAAAAVVVYDITKASSLEKAKAWVNELQRQANPNIVIALVGNKLDLITEGTTTSGTNKSSSGSKDPNPTSPVSPFATTKTGGSSKKTPSTRAGDDQDDDDDEAGRADEDEPTGANDAQERQSEGDDAPLNDEEEGEEMGSVNNNASAGEDGAAGTDSNARQVSREEAEGYAKEAGGLLFFEASAKTGKGVQEIFTEIAKNLPMDSIAPKPTTTGAQGGSRRAAGGNGTGSEANRVNLGEQGQKAKGGCC